MATRSLLPFCALALLLACGDKDDGDSGSSVTTEADADGDGHPASVDCDDNDAAVNPGAAEVCDGADNDCDGLVDDDDDSLAADSVATFYVDSDGDGHGVPGETVAACAAPEGYAETADDCDDLEATTSPTAAEVCDDGVDNNCTIITDCDDSACGGDAACQPVLTEVSPDAGAYFPMSVTLTGAGFAYDTAGTTSVTVDGAAAADVVVVDDSTITATFPAAASPVGDVDVVLTNDNGSATLTAGFAYGECIYLATGRDTKKGSLYCINDDGFDVREVGPIVTADGEALAVTGLAAHPTDGLLYATEATYGGASRLFSIDPATAEATIIGPLTDSRDPSGTHGSVPDITFVGSRLVGWSHHYLSVGGTVAYNQPVEINTSTGETTFLATGSGEASCWNCGLAADSAGMVYLLDSGLDGTLYRVNPTTGMMEELGDIDDTSLINNGNSGATFHEGNLVALDCDYGASGACALGFVADHDTSAPAAVVDSFNIILPSGVDGLASFNP
jgi:hypothetical protein